MKEFIYLIDGVNDSKEYVQDLYRIGINCALMTELDGDKLKNLKLKYLDYGPIHIRSALNKDKYDFLKGKDIDNIYYKSSRCLIYNQKPYYCEASIEKGEPVPSVGHSSPQKVIDNELFWKESEKFIFLEKR